MRDDARSHLDESPSFCGGQLLQEVCFIHLIRTDVPQRGEVGQCLLSMSLIDDVAFTEDDDIIEEAVDIRRRLKRQEELR